MRRSRGPLSCFSSTAACLALLATQPVGRLVNGTTDSPVVVVNYVVRDDAIVFRSDAGARRRAILGSTVALRRHVRRAHLIRVSVVAPAARDVTWSEGAEPQPEVDTWAPGPKSRWFRITVDEITGRLLRGEVPASWVNPDAIYSGPWALPARCEAVAQW